MYKLIAIRKLGNATIKEYIGTAMKYEVAQQVASWLNFKPEMRDLYDPQHAEYHCTPSYHIRQV